MNLASPSQIGPRRTVQLTRWESRGKTLRFAAKTVVPTQQQKDGVGKLRWYKKLYNGMISMYPVSNLLGGLCILTSGMIPDTPKITPPQPAQMSKPLEEAAPVALSQVQDNPQAILQDFKSVLSNLGWRFFVPIAFVTSGLTGLSNGFLQKQPTMVLSNLVFLGITPSFMIEPTVPLRAAVLMTVGLFSTGFANTLNNRYRNQNGKPPREMDMAPLISPSALKALVGHDNPTTLELARTWMGQAAKATRFVVVDHMLMIQNTAKAAVYPVTHPKAFSQDAKQFMSQVKAVVKNRGKATLPDGKPAPTLASLLKPNGTLNQVGAFLTYMGSIPMMVVTGPQSAVIEVGAKLISAGILTTNLSLFAVGLDRAKDNTGKAILVGVPLKAVGDAFLQTDVGYGASMMGVSGMATYFAEQGKIKAPQSQTEPAQTPPPKDPAS